MTTVMISMIAVILFAMALVATLSYGDALGISSTSRGVVLAQRLQSAAELVAQIDGSTGSRPHTSAQLIAAGMPDYPIQDVGELRIVCVDAASCSPMSLCLVQAESEVNIDAARIAADRIKGTISGACGDDAALIDGEVAITIRI